MFYLSLTIPEEINSIDFFNLIKKFGIFFVDDNNLNIFRLKDATFSRDRYGSINIYDLNGNICGRIYSKDTLQMLDNGDAIETDGILIYNNDINNDIKIENECSDEHKKEFGKKKKKGFKENVKRIGYYKTYCKTDHFFKLSQLVCNGKVCAHCGANVKLTCHHNSYKHLWNLDKEVKDCIPLCKECHTKIWKEKHKND